MICEVDSKYLDLSFLFNTGCCYVTIEMVYHTKSALLSSKHGYNKTKFKAYNQLLRIQHVCCSSACENATVHIR